MPSFSTAVPVALAVRLDAELVTAVAHQLGGRLAVASVPHVAAACQAMAKHHVGVVLASSSLPFWDRHVLADRATRDDVQLCFIPSDADASNVVDLLANAPPSSRRPSVRSTRPSAGPNARA
jgi:hypothetical protein